MASESEPPLPSDGNDPLVGVLIGGRYRLLERIGEGGMGVVYRAEHVLMKKPLAVKLLHPELSRLDQVARRFEREAQSASRLSHDHIIQVTDFGRTDDGHLFLVMELLRGEPLAEKLAREGRLGVARAVAIMRQVVDALAHAHAQGVVHRDLKPDNIMLVERSPAADWVKILDFGIAKMSEEQPGEDQPGEDRPAPLTQAGVVFGTPDYMAPEQVTGDPTDGRTDIYACGVMLFEMIVGRRPFVAESRVALVSLHLTQRPPSPRSLAPEAEIPGAIEEVVLRALEKEPDKRYASAAELLLALDQAPEVERQRLSLPARISRSRPVVRASESAVALWNRLPPETRFRVDEARRATRDRWQRLSEPTRRRASLAGLGLLAIVAMFLFRGPRGPASNPPPLRPLPAAVAEQVRLAEDSLAHGDHGRARTVLTELLSRHPEIAAVHYLLGNVDFLDRQAELGLSSYRQALKLDPGYRADAALLRNARTLLDDKKLAADALDLLMYDVGKPACQVLAEVAGTDCRPELRHAALKSCDELGCPERVDLLQSYSLDLQQGKGCDERRDAVKHLVKLDDRRALDPLRKARQRRSGGFFGVFESSPNDCIKKDLDDAIHNLEGR